MTDLDDPVFAAIERYKQVSVEYTAAIDREDEASADALFEQMEDLFTLRPTTMAGAVALLKYISELEDWQLPPGLEDGNGKTAVQTLCASLPGALEQIRV